MSWPRFDSIPENPHNKPTIPHKFRKKTTNCYQLVNEKIIETIHGMNIKILSWNFPLAIACFDEMNLEF